MRQLKILLVDLLLVAVATLMALVLRDNLELSHARVEQILPYLALSVSTALLVLPFMGMTRTLWRFSGIADYMRLALSCALVVLVAVSAGFAWFRLDGVMRSLPILQLMLMIMLLAGWRLQARSHRFRHRRQAEAEDNGPAPTTVLVVGLNSISELYLQAMREHAAGTLEIAGVIGRSGSQRGRLFRGHRVLGVPEDIGSIISELDVHGVNVDRIVIAQPFEQLSEAARTAILELEKGSQIEIDLLAERLQIMEHRTALDVRAAVSPRRSAPACSADELRLAQALRRPYWKIKRIADVVVAVAAIMALAPMMLLIAILTAANLGTPVVFWQRRPGHKGHPFKLYKFRTLLGALDVDGNRLPDQQRETGFGRFMRDSRLDELPQLFNILAGHMSFVGPRPLLLTDQPEGFRDRLEVRPGLTGWAQANGGKSVSPKDKMALDHWYILNASLLLDCRIVLMTARMILLGERTNPAAVERAWDEMGQRALSLRN